MINSHCWELLCYFGILVLVSFLHAEEIHTGQGRKVEPLQYETGDVTINLKLEAERLKRVSESRFQSLLTTFENRNQKEKIEKIRTAISEGSTEYLRGDFTLARRLLKAAIQDMESAAGELNASYRESFREYTSQLNSEIMKLKEDRQKLELNPNLLPFLEKKAQDASEFYRQAEFLARSGQNASALHKYQLSIRALMDAILRSREEWDRKLNPDEYWNENDRNIYYEVRGILKPALKPGK